MTLLELLLTIVTVLNAVALYMHIAQRVQRGTSDERERTDA
jgi:hypothetical protein